MRRTPTTREKAGSDRMISPPIQVVKGLILSHWDPIGISRTFPIHDRVFSCPLGLMAGAILTQFVSPLRRKICKGSWCRTAFAPTTRIMSNHMRPCS